MVLDEYPYFIGFIYMDKCNLLELELLSFEIIIYWICWWIKKIYINPFQNHLYHLFDLEKNYKNQKMIENNDLNDRGIQFCISNAKEIYLEISD